MISPSGEPLLHSQDPPESDVDSSLLLTLGKLICHKSHEGVHNGSMPDPAFA